MPNAKPNKGAVKIEKPKDVKRGPKSVFPPWVEKIAENGAMHRLAIEGIIVAKPMVDIKGIDLVAFVEQTGVLAYIQVKGRQTANKRVRDSEVFAPTTKMTSVALPPWIDQDPLWFVVIYWMQKEVFLVFSGKELVADFMAEGAPKLLYKVSGYYKFEIDEKKLTQLKRVRPDAINNFQKIAVALVRFPINGGGFSALQGERMRLSTRLAKEAEDAYRNSARNRKAQAQRDAAQLQLSTESRERLKAELSAGDDNG